MITKPGLIFAAACLLACATGFDAVAQTSAVPADVRPTASPGKEFKDGFFETGEFRIHYKEAGPKDAPVLISLPGSAGMEMSKAKDILIRQYRIIEINPPGWGNDPELTREMNQDEIGKILGAIANQLVSGKYHVLGTSMGGGNALWLAYHYPERVRSVVLEGSMTPTRQSDLSMPMIYRDEVRKRLAAGQNPLGPPRGAPTAAAQYPAPPVDPTKPWAGPDYMREQMAKRMKIFKWVQTDMGAEPLFSKLRSTNIPILSLIGDKDGIIKPSIESYYREVLPKAKFVLVSSGGHDLQNSQTETFVREVTQFIAQH